MDRHEITLAVETPEGVFLRKVSPAVTIGSGIPGGPAIEFASRHMASRWGMPDFVFNPALAKSGSGVREVGDGVVVVGRRAAVLQVKSRSVAPQDDQRERLWLDKVIADATRQAQGTLRKLESAPQVLENARGRQVKISGEDHEWTLIVIVDHPALPEKYVPKTVPPVVVLSRRDWEFLFQQLRSTYAVLDYLGRVAFEDAAPLDFESRRYYEVALTDADTSPALYPEWVRPGGIHQSNPRAPLAPAGHDDTRAHLLLRAVMEVIAVAEVEAELEVDRLNVLAELDRLPVACRTELGRTLLRFRNEARDWTGDALRTNARIIVPTTTDHAVVLFMVASKGGDLAQDAFRYRLQLLHHEYYGVPGRESEMTIGVLLTPALAGAPGWDTTMTALLGEQGLSEREVDLLRALNESATTAAADKVTPND